MEDKIQFAELLTLLDDGLVSNKDPAVELGREVTDKFLATLHADITVLILKNMLEVV